MKKGIKAAIIVASCCLGVGIALGVVGFALNGGKFMKRAVVHIGEEIDGALDDNTFVEKVYEAESASIDSIHVTDRNNAIEVYPSSDGKLRITYYESNRIEYDIEESANQLRMKVEDNKKWYDYIHFGWWYDDDENIDMKIEVPEQMAAQLNIETSNARINVEDVMLKENCLFHSSNGRIELSSVSGDAVMELETSNGKVILSDVKGKEIEADTSNGSVELYNVEAKELGVDTSNASIKLGGTILSDDIDLETSNGKVEGMITGRESDYEITSKTSNGNNSLPEDRSGGTKKLRVKTSNGRIDVSFSER